MAVRYGSVGVATTRTVPPAPAASGAAATVDEWTDMPLDLDNFHITARDGATQLAKWNITNPTGTSIRVERTFQQVAGWKYGSGLPLTNDEHQKGPCLIFKTQMDPRPLAAHALSGVTDKRWRHGECQLTVAMRVGSPFHTSGVGNGIAIGCGVGFLFSKTDIGSGASLVTANPTPPFVGNQSSVGANQYHYFRGGFLKDNSASSDVFRRDQSGRGDGGTGVNWQDSLTSGAGLFGATSQLDTAIVQLPHHPFNNDANKGLARVWYEDSRVNRATVNGYYQGAGRADSLLQLQSYAWRTEGTYVYIALFPQVMWNDPALVGSAMDILELKYNLSHIKVGA